MDAVGAWVPASQVGAAMVAACRKWEEDEASEALDHLLHICKAHRVDARKLIVSGDDLPGGLVRLVADHGVAELVMGAAADRAYSRCGRPSPRRRPLSSSWPTHLAGSGSSAKASSSAPERPATRGL